MDVTENTAKLHYVIAVWVVIIVSFTMPEGSRISHKNTE